MLKPKQFGFTLLETITAIGVMAVGGIAVLTVINSTLSKADLNRDLIVVVNLAREGAEIVRSLRDSDAAGFTSLNNGDYIVDSDSHFNLSSAADSSQVVNCNNCMLNFYNNRYVHDLVSGSPTNYKRLINICDDTVPGCNASQIVCVTAAACQKKITSTIFWQSKGLTHTYSLIVHLTDWR